MDHIYDTWWFEKEEITTSDASMIFSLVLIFISILITLYYVFKVREARNALTSFKNTLLQIYLAEIFLLLKAVFSFVDFSIWYITDGEYTLNGVFESVALVLALGTTFVMIYKGKVIKIPSKRETNRKLILITLAIAMIISLIVVYLINFTALNIYEEAIYVTYAFILVGVVLIEIYIEFRKINSGINKIKMNIVVFILFFFLGYVVAAVYGYAAMDKLYPDGTVAPWYNSTIVFLITIQPVILSMLFYWLVNVPDFLRQKYKRN